MKNKEKIKLAKAQLRKKRVRVKILGTVQRPRLSVFRSLKHLYVQIIDDTKSKTLLSVKDTEIKKKAKPVEIAFEVGKLVAEKALKKNITEVIFDRGKFKYHGRVQAVADGAREAGLKF